MTGRPTRGVARPDTDWEHARLAIKEAHEYYHYGTNEDARDDALRYTIAALVDLYALLKPPSAEELFHDS